MKRNFVLVTSLLINLSCITPSALAKEESRKFPMGCRQMGFEMVDGQLSLKVVMPDGLPQTLYLIHNKTSYDILLKNATASKFLPTYEKMIPHGRWAAFARDVSQINFICNTPDGQFLDCKETLEVCNYNNVKFPDTNYGTYWITNTGSQHEAMRGSINKGILLRW